MELEEMKSLWNDMSARVEKIEIVNQQNIIKMTEQKYRNTFSFMFNAELIGALISFLFGAVIIYNFGTFNTWYLQLCGFVGLLMYVLIPVIVVVNIKNLKQLDLATNNQKNLFAEFTKRKKRLLFIQQFSGTYVVLTMFVTMPISAMIFNGKDFFLKEHSPYLWLFLAAAAIVMLFIARRGNACYKKATASAEATLMELGD